MNHWSQLTLTRRVVLLPDTGVEPCLAFAGVAELRVRGDESRERLLRVDRHNGVNGG